ncbi:SPOR domain-containing protein [Altericroceibacterium spongiae]|nr:SPOR domain-containing protein [Altericroceibacterium spongiae]
MNRLFPAKTSCHLALTACAGLALIGCTTPEKPDSGIRSAGASAHKAETQPTGSKHDKTIRQAESAVQSDPRNPTYRAALGSAYLDAGRFASAATTFNDAVLLGDRSEHTALQLALALIGSDQKQAAADLLDHRAGSMAPADAGLAFALAGDTRRGIAILSVAIRSGDNTMRIRQNLALAYALAGQWREARAMAAQDIPPAKLGDRMEQWAQMAMAKKAAIPVARLLNITPAGQDSGQPARLALNTVAPAMLAQAAAPLPATSLSAGAAAAELPPLALNTAAPTESQHYARRSIAPSGQRTSISFVAPAPGPVGSEDMEAQLASATSLPSPAAIAPQPPHRLVETHLVQLGSFASEQDARRAWTIYQSKLPSLDGHRLILTRARVKGRIFWRVAAGGFDKAKAISACAAFKRTGQGCLAYASSKPLPGTLGPVTQMALR